MTGRRHDLSTFDRKLVEHLAEGGTCVHSYYVENCAGCIIRELERALAMMLDLHDGNFQGEPFHGLVTATEEEVVEAARHRLSVVDPTYKPPLTP
jgi:hypothetical protein